MSTVSGAAPSKGGDGERASVLVMPGYRIAPATVARDDVPHGRVVVVDEPPPGSAHVPQS